MTDVTQGNQTELRDQTGTIQDQTKDTTGSSPDNQQKPTDQTTKAEPDQSKTAQSSKPEDDKSKSPLNQGQDEKKDDKPAGAPEKYEAFKVPEGFTLDEAVAGEAGTLFKELNLSQEQGQKLVDLYTKTAQEAFDAPFKAWSDQQEAWRKEVNDDPNLGPRMGEIKTAFSKMLDGLGDPEGAKAFREAMDYTGAGNNPAFIRMMDKLSQNFTEGKPVQGAKPAPVREPGKAQGTGPAALWPGLPSAS